MEYERQSFLYDKLLPRLEQVSWPLAAIGLALAYFPFPGGSLLLTLGVYILATVYFLQTFSPNPTVLTTAPVEETGDFFEPNGAGAPPAFIGLVASKVVGTGSAIALIGLLFKLLFWKGADNLLLAGAGSLILALVLLAGVGQFSRRGFTIAVLSSSLLFVSTETLIQVRYHDDPALAAKVLLQYHYPTGSGR